MIQIYSLNARADSKRWTPEEVLEILTPKRKAKALRFRRSGDQWRGMMAGVLEEFSLQQCFGIPWQQQQIKDGPYGKPYLADQTGKYYNLSHSGDWIVCAVGEAPVGIDVERSDKYSERVVRRFFHPNEVQDILAQKPEERPDVFAEYWTMKESFMKLSGLGFELQLRQFATNRQTGEVRLLSTQQTDSINIQAKSAGNLAEFTHAVCQFFPLEIGYRMAVCTQTETTMQHQIVTLETCMQELFKSSRHQSE